MTSTRWCGLGVFGLVASSIALGGCILGGQTGQESQAQAPPDCMFERSEVAPDSRDALGFSAAEVEAALSAPATSSLHWHRMDAHTVLTLELLEVNARHAKRSRTCSDELELEARISVHTADGLLDETLDATIRAVGPTSARIHANVAPDALQGGLSADLLNLDLGTWRDPVFSLQFDRSGEQFSGWIWFGGADPDPSDHSVPAPAAIAEVAGP